MAMPSPDAAHGAPRPGEMIADRYRVEQVIGVGGMGVVVAARHATLGQRVAIKVLLPHAARLEEAVARFVREARAAAAIESEHVARVIDVGELPRTDPTAPARPFMVMEFLSGSDLGAELHRLGRLPQTDAVDYVLQACEAIAHAHAHGIIHRDLKPSNLFLTRRADGTPCVKVLDFGISKITRGEDVDVMLTATSHSFGTPVYMSPEQIRSLKAVDARTDVWALGVILHQLVSGKEPFEAQTLTALCAAIASDPPTPLSAHLPDVSRDLEAIVLRCLEKVPARRFADVGELAEALRPLASAEGRRMVDVVRAIAARGAPTGPVALPSPPVADPRAHTASAWGTRTGKVGLSSRKTLYALGAVGLVVTVAGVAFLLGSGSRRPPPSSAPVATAVSVAPTAVASSAPVEPAPRASVEAIPSAPTATSSSPKKRPVPRGPNVDPLKDRR